MLQIIHKLDTAITVWLFTNTPRTDLVDTFFLVLSAVVGGWIIAGLIGILMIYLLYRQYYRLVGELLSATGIGYVLNEFVFKSIIMRARPFQALVHELGTVSSSSICPENFSFPSSHTVVAFTAATVLERHYGNKHIILRVGFYLLAFLVGYSRIYLGCHFAFDVLAGAIVGIAVGYVVHMGVQRYHKSE
ncbi:MAG: phosphatase PAP2 family protein [Patescibacteria group bacterium]